MPKLKDANSDCMEYKTFDPASLETRELHPLLLDGIAPRPIAFASTMDEHGRPNLAPFSFFNVFSANPPVLIFSPARRGKDNTTKHTLENVLKVPEVVINLVDFAMVEQCSLASGDFAAGVNEFEKAGLTAIASETVKPHRVAESPLQLECRVLRVDSLGEGPGAGQLVVCEITRMHYRRDVLNDQEKPDSQALDLVGRCGGNWYVRASGEALFEVAKPLSAPGIGFDAIPDDVRNSKFFDRNALAQLASIPALPDETEVNEYRLTELADLIMDLIWDGEALEQALHERAATALKRGEIWEAWLTVLAFNAG